MAQQPRPHLLFPGSYLYVFELNRDRFGKHLACAVFGLMASKFWRVQRGPQSVSAALREAEVVRVVVELAPVELQLRLRHFVGSRNPLELAVTGRASACGIAVASGAVTLGARTLLSAGSHEPRQQ